MAQILLQQSATSGLHQKCELRSKGPQDRQFPRLVIGPFSFPQYTSPLFKIAENHQCSISMYADDMQIYMSFKHEDVVKTFLTE